MSAWSSLRYSLTSCCTDTASCEAAGLGAKSGSDDVNDSSCEAISDDEGIEGACGDGGEENSRTCPL